MELLSGKSRVSHKLSVLPRVCSLDEWDGAFAIAMKGCEQYASSHVVISDAGWIGKSRLENVFPFSFVR